MACSHAGGVRNSDSYCCRFIIFKGEKKEERQIPSAQCQENIYRKYYVLLYINVNKMIEVMVGGEILTPNGNYHFRWYRTVEEIHDTGRR
jgi:hypothetical protein